VQYNTQSSIFAFVHKSGRFYECSVRHHAEKALMKNEQFDTRGVLKITIVRAKMVDGNLQLSCALPCTHCRSSLTSFIKYRYQKYGQVVRLQYSTNEGTLSPFMRIYELPPSSLSSGSPFTTWRKA